MVSVISTLISCAVYFLIWFVFPTFFELYRIDDWGHLYKMLIVILIGYAPILVL